MDWAFLPLFSKWTGLKFVEIWKKKLKKFIVWISEKKRDWYDSVKFEHLSDFQQILPTFCHGTKVKPWKFEKKNYQNDRSFDVWERKKGRKKASQTNKQTGEILKSKENSLTNKQTSKQTNKNSWKMKENRCLFSGFLKSVPYRSN